MAGSVIKLVMKPIVRPIIYWKQYCVLSTTQAVQSTKQITELPPPKDEESLTYLKSVLNQKNKKNMTPTKAVEIMNLINKHLNDNAHGISMKDIKDHEGFLNLCSFLGKSCTTLNHPYLLTCLKSMMQMGVPHDEYVVQSLSTQALWSIRKMSIRSLAFLLSFHGSHQEGDLQKKLVKHTVESIERRWVEIDSISDACQLLPLKLYFSPQFLEKLDDRMVELVERSDTDEYSRLFVALAETKCRWMPVMRSLAFHLCKSDGKLNVKQVVDILNAVNKLNFLDLNLLKRLSADLVSEIGAIEKSSTIAAILTAMGQMQWKNEELMENCTTWIRSHFDQCRVQDLVAYVITCGRLNYISEGEKALFSQLKNKITQASVPTPMIWLDVVWSFVVLQQATADQISSVLRLDFTSNDFSATQKSKLWNINAAAKIETPSYKGPFLSLDLADATVPLRQDAQKLKLSIIDALNNFVPRGKYSTINKLTTYGIYIDAEFIIDKHKRPLPIFDYRMNVDGGSLALCKQLPHGASRIALMIWNFKDLTLNNELTGATNLTVRILRKLGYLVVQIQHFEFPVQESILKKVQFLQQQIESTVHQK